MINLIRRAYSVYAEEGLGMLLSKTNSFLQLRLWILYDTYGPTGLSRKQVLYKWMSEKTARQYTDPVPYSEVLYELIKTHATSETTELSVCEVGCNVGRHLVYFHEQGIRGLHGIEISPVAAKVHAEEFPDVAADTSILVGRAQQRIRELEDEQFDVVFSCGAMMHMVGDQSELFDHIARISSDLIITLEMDEFDRIPDSIMGPEERAERFYTDGTKHVEPRNYREIFEPKGYEQVKRIDAWKNSETAKKIEPFKSGSKGETGTVRVFKKRPVDD